MNVMLKLIFLFLFSFTLYGQEVSAFLYGSLGEKVENNQSFDEELEETVYKQETVSKTLFASYKELPTNAYVGELIPLNLRIVSTKKFDNIKLLANEEEGSIFIFEQKWREDSENTYENKVYFKANKPMDHLPKFEVQMYQNGEFLDSSYLDETKLNIIELNDDDGRFINVFAKNFTIKKFKTTQFNDSSSIMVLEILCEEASFSDIKFSKVIKQGLDSKSGKFPNETLYYFLIFSNDKSEINFSYFNTNINEFEIINLPVVVEQDDLSTQIDLNPKKSKYEFYKDIAIMALVVFLLLLFLYYRRYFLVILALIFIAYLFYFRGTTRLIINSDSKIRILPTEKSTIFYTTSSPIEVEQLNKVGQYIKVLLPNKKIGWIKKEDVFKN